MQVRQRKVNQAGIDYRLFDDDPNSYKQAYGKYVDILPV